MVPIPEYGFVIDNRRCIGCHACTVACKAEHDDPIGVNKTWVKYIEKGEFPNTNRNFSVMRCNHCADSPCTDVCPVTALWEREDDYYGDVYVDTDRAMEIYREWVEKTKPAPGPDGRRRPKWLKQPIAPPTDPDADDAWFVDGPVGRPERWDLDSPTRSSVDD